MSAVHMSALGSEDWELTDEPGPKPGCLIVQLRRRAHVMPWFRFAYAEGDNGGIVAVFASHIVTVSGHGLAVLLAAISTQRVVRLIQPTENEAKFGVRGPGAARYDGPSITEISVEPIK